MAWNGSDEKVGRSVPDRRNGKDNDNHVGSGLRRPQSGTPYRGLVAGLVVVVGGAIAAYLMLGRPGTTSADGGGRGATRPTAIAEATPSVERVEKRERKPYARPVKRTEAQDTGERPAAAGGEIASAEADAAETNATATVPQQPAATSPFKNPSDQVFAMVASAGENVPPLPGTEEMLEESFYKSFERPIEILDDDSESVKAAKRAVNEIREEMKAEVTGGRPVKEVLDEYRKKMEKISAMKVDVRQIAKEMMDEGDREGAEAFVEKANKMLEQEGASPVEKPLTDEEEEQKLIEAAERKDDLEENEK